MIIKLDTTRDEQNPEFMYQTTSTELLMAIAKGEINPVELAKREMASRGLDIRTGKWVGFEKAKEAAELHAVRRGNKLVWVSIPK